MSEIYLTKIERKTIFTKALIFVLVLFIICDLTVTGPFWFNFIPWLFIIGLVGSIKKIDSVLMCLISTFTVFISSAIMQGDIFIQYITATVVALANIILGIITGRICYEFILEHRLVKYIKRSKKITYIVFAIVMFLASYFMVALNSGNIVTYLKSRANIKEYIEKTYNIKEFSIKKVQFVKEVPGKYTFDVELKGQKVHFTPVTRDVFKDTNRDYRLLNMLRDLDSETLNEIDLVLNKYSLLTESNARFSLEYNSVSVLPDTMVLKFKYNGNLNDDNVDSTYEQIANCVKELQNVKEAQKIIIQIGENTLQLSYENLENLTSEYIKGGFEIEEISE